MGKLKALRLGIVKSIQHTKDTVDPRHRAAKQLLEKLTCLDCKHPSLSHSKRKPAFEKTPKAELREAIFQTGSPGSGGFHECTFFYCDDCEHKTVEKYLAGCKL